MTEFFARFVTGLWVIGAMAAGTAGMRWRRFFLADTAGALLWVVSISLLGYVLGESWNLVHRWLGWAGLVLLVLMLGLIGAWYFARAKKRP